MSTEDFSVVPTPQEETVKFREESVAQIASLRQQVLELTDKVAQAKLSGDPMAATYDQVLGFTQQDLLVAESARQEFENNLTTENEPTMKELGERFNVNKNNSSWDNPTYHGGTDKRS